VITFASFGAAAAELLYWRSTWETAALAQHAAYVILTVKGAQLAAVLRLIVI